MNIIELCLSPAKGGLELYAFRVAKELSNTYNVTAVVAKSGELESLIKNNHIEYINSKVSFKPLPILSAIKLARAFVKNDIDIVHVHWVKDLPLAALAKKLSRKKPKIVFTRQMQITRNKKDFYHRFIYKEVDKFIAITKRVASDLKNYLPDFCADKIDVLYYGVPEPKEFLSDIKKENIRTDLGISNHTFLVGLFGRIKDEKGQHLLVDAIEQLKIKDNIDATALIVGHPMREEYLDKMKEDVVKRGLGENIIFKDFINDPQSLMQVCDVIVLATYEETFGLVLAEAMRAGVAVVGSNSGGVPEIINHKEDGMLFKTKDANDLYVCLKLAMKDTDLLKSIALKGKIKADGLFDYDNHFYQLSKKMKNLVNDT